MLVSEVRAIANKAALDREFAGRNARVIVILPKDGKEFYVGLRGTTENKDEAFVYNYDNDGVADQCSQVIEMMGVMPIVREV
jgi:hypothetical protein